MTWLEKGHCYHGKVYLHTRVFSCTDVCSKGGDSSRSTLIKNNQFGSKSDTRVSPVLAEMAVQGKKVLKRKEM